MARVRETRTFDQEQVLAVIRRSSTGRSWSSIAAEILGKDRKDVAMAEVRGVRDAVKSLQAAGLVSETRPLIFAAAD